MSRELNELLRSTVDAPTRPLDATAVVGRARRQTRLAKAGGGLGAIILVVAALVVGPAVTGGDQPPEIADRPGPETVTDGPATGAFTLGEDHVWRSAPGSPDEAGLAFASEVLGWEDASIIERGAELADEPPETASFVIASATDRTVELYLEASDSVPDAWEVIQVAAGIEQPVSVTEDPSMYWRPNEEATERYRPFEGTTGVAHVRTLERGTVAIDLDAAAVADAEVSLDGYVDVGEPFCHTIQSTLLLFRDQEGAIVSAVGGSWNGDAPSDCRPEPAPSETPSDSATDQRDGRPPDPPTDEPAAEAEPTGYGRPPVGPGASVRQQPTLYPGLENGGGDETITGTLRADAEMDAGCLWLEQDGEPRGLAWIAEPLGPDHPANELTYWARFHDGGAPAELLTADGTVLAREGDEVELVGGAWNAEEELGGYAFGCQFSDEVLTVAHPDAPAEPSPTPSIDEPNVANVIELPRIYPGMSGSGEALVTGTLRADPDLDGGCIWLENEDGREDQLVWFGAYWLEGEQPEEMVTYWGRFHDDGSPAEVVSPDGTVLATEGDQVEFGGGSVPPHTLDQHEFRCQFDDDLSTWSVYP